MEAWKCFVTARLGILKVMKIHVVVLWIYDILKTVAAWPSYITTHCHNTENYGMNASML